MQDKHYDSLEDFFRKGAQKYEIEFVEEDWRKMEAKLDSSGSHSPNKWLDFLKKLFLVMGIIAVVWFGYYYMNRNSTELPKTEETLSAQSKSDDALTENAKSEAANQSDQNNSGQIENAKYGQMDSENNLKTSVSDSQLANINDEAKGASPEGIAAETNNQSDQNIENLSDNARSQQIDNDTNLKTDIVDHQQAGTYSEVDDVDHQVTKEKTEVAQQFATLTEKAPVSAPHTSANQDSSLGPKSKESKATGVNDNPEIADPATQENIEIQAYPNKDLDSKPFGTGSVISDVRRNDNNTKVVAEPEPMVTAKEVNSDGEVTTKNRVNLLGAELNAKDSEDWVEEATNRSLDSKPSSDTTQRSLLKDNKLLDNQDGGAGGSGNDHRTVHRIMNVSSLAPNLGSAISNPEPGSTNLSNIKTPTIDEDEILSSRSSWAIGVIAAPDFSSVGLIDNLQPGKKFGVSMEYPISRKFSVSTAIVRSTNNYKVQGEVYRAPAGFWRQVTNGIVPESVSARCEILDIPINLRYTITDKPKSRLFISSGFSTYFMLNEQYDFTYRPINPGPVESWEVSNENQHIFGIVNFSAGYEFLMANNLSFQVEPFLKVPITDIGFGQVDLFSTGALFSLKYHFMRTKLRPLRIKK